MRIVGLFLVHFEGLIVGVIEEHEVLASRCIRPNGLMCNAQTIQLRYLLHDVINLECQMPQSCGFGVGRALRR